MNFSLTPELEAYIKSKTDAGGYRSASEVVREALRAMQQRDEKLDWLRKEIQKGIDSLDRGEGKVFDDAAVEDIIRRGQERLAKNSDLEESYKKLTTMVNAIEKNA